MPLARPPGGSAPRPPCPRMLLGPSPSPPLSLQIGDEDKASDAAARAVQQARTAEDRPALVGALAFVGRSAPDWGDLTRLASY